MAFFRFLMNWLFDTNIILNAGFLSAASGLLSDNEKAQDYASTGLGLLAGTTIFLLTVVWGTCIIVGSTQSSSSLNSDPSNSSSSSQSKIKTLISKTNGSLSFLFKIYTFFLKILISNNKFNLCCSDVINFRSTNFLISLAYRILCNNR